MTGRVRMRDGEPARRRAGFRTGRVCVQGSKAVYIVTPENKAALRTVVTEGSYQGKSIVTRDSAAGKP